MTKIEELLNLLHQEQDYKIALRNIDAEKRRLLREIKKEEENAQEDV